MDGWTLQWTSFTTVPEADIFIDIHDQYLAHNCFSVHSATIQDCS